MKLTAKAASILRFSSFTRRVRSLRSSSFCLNSSRFFSARTRNIRNPSTSATPTPARAHTSSASSARSSASNARPAR